MESATADAAMHELVGHLAMGHSLLAWTMRWCASGDAAMDLLWSRTTDVKAMLNVLVAVGVARSVAVRAGAADIAVRLVVTRADGSVIDESVSPAELPSVIRRAFAAPTLTALINAVSRTRGPTSGPR